MAKRKLSPEKRVELRAGLRKSIAAGRKVADVLREIVAKYGISTITARWYLKSLDGKKKAVRRGRKPGRPAGSNGSTRFLKDVMARTESAKTAGKLIPRWQALVDKESALRRQALKVGNRLEAVAQRARKLRSRITELVGK